MLLFVACRYIPHPMILGQVCALAGVLRAAHFRRSPHWYVALVHVALYLAHMLQEHCDIFDKSRAETARKEEADKKKIC